MFPSCAAATVVFFEPLAALEAAALEASP